MSVAENAAPLHRESRSRPGGAAAAQTLARVGLAGKGALADQLTYIDQKRLELAARSREPDLLLLDEWLAGLNPTELQEGIALIRALQDVGFTIILVEHVMDAIRSLCGRCIVMNAGRKIADGSPTTVLADRDVVVPISEKPMLEVGNLSVFYGKHQARQHRLDIKRGEVVTILGANGAGGGPRPDRSRVSSPPPGAPQSRRQEPRWTIHPREIVEAGMRSCRKTAASSAS